MNNIRVKFILLTSCLDTKTSWISSSMRSISSSCVFSSALKSATYFYKSLTISFTVGSWPWCLGQNVPFSQKHPGISGSILGITLNKKSDALESNSLEDLSDFESSSELILRFSRYRGSLGEPLSPPLFSAFLLGRDRWVEPPAPLIGLSVLFLPFERSVSFLKDRYVDGYYCSLPLWLPIGLVSSPVRFVRSLC